MSTRNVPPWYGVSDGPVFKRYSELKQELVRRENECVHTKAWWYKETTFPAVSWERFAHISNTLEKREQRERDDDIRTRDGPAHVRQRVPDEFHRHSGGFVRGNFSQLFR